MNTNGFSADAIGIKTKTSFIPDNWKEYLSVRNILVTVSGLIIDLPLILGGFVLPDRTPGTAFI
jgi:hypothetical protein